MLHKPERPVIMCQKLVEFLVWNYTIVWNFEFLPKSVDEGGGWMDEMEMVTRNSQNPQSY